MRKTLSLLALLMAFVSSAWADGEVFTASPKTAWSVPANTEGDEITSSYATITGGKMYVYNKQGSAKDLIKMLGELAFQFTNNDTFFKVELDQALEAGDVISTRMQSRTDTDLGIWFSTAASRPGSAPTAKIVLETAAAQKWVEAPTYTVTAGDGICGENAFYMYRHTGKSTYFNTFSISRANAPSLTPSVTAISLSVSPKASSVEGNFTLTGNHLTDGIYNVNMPAVEGLTINPTSFTVTDGAVNQQFTVSYTSTTDVEEATANITATVNDITATVAVTYSSRTSSYTQTIVSAATTWDWTTLTETVELTAETTPSNTEEFVFKDLEDQINFGTFDAQSIVLSNTQYPSRNKMFQNGTIKIKTAVDGVIKVDFSDTGNSGENLPKRYLNVNGVNTKYYTQRTGTSNDRKESGEIEVYAGDIAITGMGADGVTSQALRIYKVSFEPKTLADAATLRTALRKAIALASSLNDAELAATIGSATAVLTNDAATAGELWQALKQLEALTIPKAQAALLTAENLVAQFSSVAATRLSDDFAAIEQALASGDVDAIEAAVSSMVNKLSPFKSSIISMIEQYGTYIDSEDFDNAIAAAKSAADYNNLLGLFTAMMEAQDDFMPEAEDLYNRMAAIALELPNAGDFNDAVAELRSALADENKSILTVGEAVKKVIDLYQNQDVELTAVKMEITDAQYATFVAPFDVNLPEGVTAYTVEGFEDELDEKGRRVLKLQEVGTGGQPTATTYIPAHKPVVLYSETPVNILFVGTPQNFKDGSPYTNDMMPAVGMLVGVYQNFSQYPGNAYVLTKQENAEGEVAVEFYKAVSGVTPDLPANRCFLVTAMEEIIAPMGIRSQNGDATAIEAVSTLTTGKSEIYNVNGVKQSRLQKGLNIVKQGDKSFKVIVK